MKKYLSIILRVGLCALCLLVLGSYMGITPLHLSVPGTMSAMAIMVGFDYAVTPEQSGMVIAYKNADLIADLVMPRCNPFKSTKRTFNYFERNLKAGFTVPDTAVSRKGRPNSVDFDGVMHEATCKPEGLEHSISKDDIQEADNGNELITQEMQAMIDLVLLAREVRVASMVQSANNYDATCVRALSGSDLFSDPSSNALNIIMKQLDLPLVRPTVLGMSQSVWTGLRQNPTIVKATNRNSGDAGAAARQAVAEILEVDEILVGKSRVNVANRGQDPNLATCWGNFLWGHYRNKNATLKNDVTWGLTAQSGTRYTSVNEDTEIGLEGGYRIVVGEYVKELVLGKSAGFLLQNVVAS